MRNVVQIIDESISFEMETYKLYSFFSETFSLESNFWNQLAEEELNHVTVLRKILSFYQGNESVLESISPSDIEEVRKSRNHLNKLFEEFKNNPKRDIAFKIAMEIEESVSESSYQNFMTKITDNPVATMFQFLNGQEKDHLLRVQKQYKLKI